MTYYLKLIYFYNTFKYLTFEIKNLLTLYFILKINDNLICQ